MPIANRRSALLALATTAVAVPALLQTSAAFAQQMNGEDYRNQTLAAGTFSLETSRDALNKAQNPMVKEFAQLEVSEQETIAAILTMAANMTPPALPPEKTTQLQQIQTMAAGPDYDRAYVDAQIAGHQELLGIQQSISAMTQLSVEVVTAKLAEQAITSHLAMLNHIREQLTAA